MLKPVDADKDFLYRLIQTQQFDNIANQSAGSKMPRADWNLISNSVFMVPLSQEEQGKIGTYFSNLDHIITFHQRKHEKYKKHKNDIKNIKLSLIRFCIIKNNAIFIILKIYILFIKAEIVAYKLSLERKIY